MKRKLTGMSEQKMFNRLNSWFVSATEQEVAEGKVWYSDSQEFAEDVSGRYRLNPFTVACVISALSPNNKWRRNMIDTIAVVETWIQGGKPEDVSVCTYGANKAKAFELLATNGRLDKVSIKTWNFAHNVGLLSSKHVTVDKWMVRAALTFANEGKKDTVENCTAKQYEQIADCIRKIAERTDLKAYQVQAIIWVAIRNNWE